MMTNVNNNDSSGVESELEDPKSARKRKWGRVSTVLGVFMFFACWIIFGTIITIWLTGMGLNIVLAVIAGIIGGFIAAVIATAIGGSGFPL